jgi:alanine racemase
MAYITLNKNNFFNNLDIIANQTKSKEKIALVLKDNAYGHGLQEIASMAHEYGISKAVVKSFDEAKKIEQFFEYILILSDFPREQNGKFRYTINDIDAIEKFEKEIKVELKVDTGMHRNGISMEQFDDAVSKIKEQGLELEAVFTHHRSADELSSEWYWQKENFTKMKTKIDNVKFHSCNSAALFRTNDFDEDMVRVGIAAYGCLEMPVAFKLEGLKPVLSLYAEKISSRVVKKGQAVGYGATFRVSEDCTVSNYDFGYGDGFLRICSNNYITPQGHQLIGRVSMDNSSFLSSEEELLVFDDARKMAKSAQTISYEVLTSLKENLQRKIV